MDTSDFILTTSGVTGASITGVSGSGQTYTVTVYRGSGLGTIRLDVVDDDSIVSGAPLGDTGVGNGNFSTGQTYTIANLTVTTIVDETTSNTLCSLREAIINANDDAQTYPDCVAGILNDTITFSVSGTIALGSTLPQPTDSDGLTIDGIGQTVVISGSNSYRVMYLPSGSSFTINHLTISNGNLSGDFGAGIFNNGADLTIINSTISGNTSDIAAGGLYNGGGTLSISNSTITGNTASAGSGGGIRIGGGIVTITNSTISGNNASVSGGGIYLTTGTVTLNNSIVADSISGSDCYKLGGTLNGSSNLIETDGAAGNACGTTAPINTDPGLGALANNGGPTQTFALTGSSAALGAADSSFCDDNPGPNNLDQRGVARPQNGGCDIGAYESNAQSGPAFVVNSNEDTTDGYCDGYVAGVTDCTLREAMTYADSIGGADTITFTDALGTATIKLQSDLPTITAGSGLTINGGDDITVDGNLSSNRPFLVSSGAVFTILNLTVSNGYSSGVGGGLRNNGGQVAIIHSTFYGNIADQGGGIYNNTGGILTVTGSSFVDNYSNAGYGAAIFTNDATATITNSTFSNNYAALEGGGIDNFGTGILTVTNSTFSGNQSPTSGKGGGIYNHGTLHLRNTILANSVSSSDCYNSGGTIAADSTHNLIVTNGAGVNACGTPSVTANPNLGALTGSPAYFPFNGNSSAFNAGDDATCLASPVNNTSQNGVIRPQGGHCDIGSFELFIHNLFLPMILR